MIYVTVQHSKHGKPYTFKCYESYIEVGDVVVVDTVSGFALAQVVELGSCIPPERVTREVVAVVDTRGFYDRRENREKAGRLKKEMDKYIDLLKSEGTLYELLESVKPTFASLYDEYKALTE